MKLLLIILSSVALINMIALSGLILMKRPRSLKNKILLGIVIKPVLSVSLALVRYLNLFSDYSFFIALDYVTSYVWPVLIFIYVKLSLQQKLERGKVMAYFLPALLVLFSMIGLLSWEKGRALLNQTESAKNYFLTVLLEFPFLILSFVFLIISRAKVARYLKGKKTDSQADLASLNVLKNFIQTLFMVMVVVASVVILFPETEYFVLFLSLAVIIPYFYFFFKLLSRNPFFSNQGPILGASPVKNNTEELLQLKVDRKEVNVKLSEVLFARAEEKYTRIHLKKTNYLSDYSLTELEKKYPAQLTRIHRNALVNIKGIKNLEKLPGGKLKLFMEDGSSLEVSRRMAENIKGLLPY